MSSQSSRSTRARLGRGSGRRHSRSDSATLPVWHRARRKQAAILPPEPFPQADLPPSIPNPTSSRRAIRLPDVLALVGCGRSHWYALLNKRSSAYDPDAPQPFKLGWSERSPSVWWEHEVLAWLEARAQRRFH